MRQALAALFLIAGVLCLGVTVVGSGNLNLRVVLEIFPPTDPSVYTVVLTAGEAVYTCVPEKDGTALFGKLAAGRYEILVKKDDKILKTKNIVLSRSRTVRIRIVGTNVFIRTTSSILSDIGVSAGEGTVEIYKFDIQKRNRKHYMGRFSLNDQIALTGAEWESRSSIHGYPWDLCEKAVFLGPDEGFSYQVRATYLFIVKERGYTPYYLLVCVGNDVQVIPPTYFYDLNEYLALYRRRASSKIYGYVKDVNGNPIPGARVYYTGYVVKEYVKWDGTKARDTEKRLMYTTTDENGRYEIEVTYGNIRIRACAEGYLCSSYGRLPVVEGKTYTFDIVLKPK